MDHALQRHAAMGRYAYGVRVLSAASRAIKLIQRRLLISPGLPIANGSLQHRRLVLPMSGTPSQGKKSPPIMDTPIALDASPGPLMAPASPQQVMIARFSYGI